MSTTFTKFAQWWWQGLTAPWPSRSPNKLYFERSGSEMLTRSDHQDPGTAYQLDQAKQQSSYPSSNNYLIIPKPLVINTQIPEGSRGEEVGNIAASLLPFDDAEIFVTQNDEGNELYAVLKHELVELIKDLSTFSLPLQGIAFSTSEKFVDLELPHDFQQRHLGENQFEGAPQKVQFKPLKYFVVATMLFSIAFAGMWFFEAKQQEEYSSKLAELQTPESKPQLNYTKISDELVLTSSPTTPLLTQVLEKLVLALPDDTDISQLLVNGNEIIFDGEALKASAVQISLQDSELFEKAEFVSAISADQSNLRERFKLRVSLGSSHAND